jgi:hypothetical protein
MSKFFDSELIQKELKEINELQDSIYESILTFVIMSHENKMEHIDKMTELLEKQQIMYTRVSLSDDPEAIEIKENLKKSLCLMGFAEDTNINIVFSNMKNTIKALKKYLD